MKKTLVILGLLAIGLGTIFAAAAAAAGLPRGPADLSGTWIGKTEVPNQGADELTMVLKKIAGGYAGTVADTLGIIVRDTEIKNIEIKGDIMTFSFPLIDEAIITCRMKIAEDKITGAWEHPEGSSGALEFARKK